MSSRKCHYSAQRVSFVDGPPYCASCDREMVPCPWGGWDCPVEDAGHHDGPDTESLTSGKDSSR